MLHKLVLLLLLSSILFSQCHPEKTTEHSEIQRIKIDTLYTFANFENQNIVQPTDVEILANGQVLVSDYATNKITSIDKNGNVNFSFGREGRGPGEFLNINAVFELSTRVMVFDNHLYKVSVFDNHGVFLNSYTFPSDVFNDDIAIINDSLYVVGKQGLTDSLFQIRSLTSDYVLPFEKPRMKRDDHINMKKNQNQLKAGELPDLFKNKTILRSDGQYIYGFFEGYSELSKYDLSGNLIWNRKLNLPNNKQVFADIVESTKDHSGVRSIPVLQYIFDFKVYEGGIYTLTYPSSEDPQQLIKINAKGYITDIFQLPEEPTVYHFDIDFEQNTAYFTSWNTGVVLKTDL